MNADDTKCHPDAEEGSRPAKSEVRMAEAERTIHRFHSAASEAATKPDVTADERRWTRIESRLEPDPRVAGGAALDDGFQDPNGLRTEAAESNNVAETKILHACGTENAEWVKSGVRPVPSVVSVRSAVQYRIRGRRDDLTNPAVFLY